MWHTEAEFLYMRRCVDPVVVQDMEQLLERFHDEDESDEHRERLFCEASDVPNQRGQVKHNHDEQG